MKKIATIFLSLGIFASAQTADEITRETVPGFVAFDNGLDRTPKGQHKAALMNAEFTIAHYMASESVPEGVRITYALGKLKESLRNFVYKKDQTTKGEFAFEVDKNGDWVVDMEQTSNMRTQLATKIKILEKRLAEIYKP